MPEIGEMLSPPFTQGDYLRCPALLYFDVVAIGERTYALHALDSRQQVREVGKHDLPSWQDVIYRVISIDWHSGDQTAASSPRGVNFLGSWKVLMEPVDKADQYQLLAYVGGDFPDALAPSEFIRIGKEGDRCS